MITVIKVFDLIISHYGCALATYLPLVSYHLYGQMVNQDNEGVSEAYSESSSFFCPSAIVM